MIEKNYIWGAGLYGERALQNCKELSINIAGFVDSNETLWHTEKFGLVIYPPKDILQKHDVEILIAVANKFSYIEIDNICKNAGIKTVPFMAFENDIYVRKCYSQDGEDILLQSFFEGRTEVGFYVDIGAHHPKRFSNTQIFYEKGWHGINIDAMPGSMEEFNKVRLRDINIEAGISASNDELEYYSFEESALNGFGKERSENLINTGWKLKEVLRIKTFPINDIFDKYITSDQHIDFITIDIEGFDLIILQSLNFQKYAPSFFVIEDINPDIQDITEYSTSQIYLFLKKRNYNLVGRSQRSSIFKKGL